MDDAFGHDKSLLRLKIDGAVFKINDEVALEDKEKLIVVLVCVPVILALHDTKANDRVIDLAESLVVPAVRTRLDQGWNVDSCKCGKFDIEMGRVGVCLVLFHFCFTRKENCAMADAQAQPLLCRSIAEAERLVGASGSAGLSHFAFGNTGRETDAVVTIVVGATAMTIAHLTLGASGCRHSECQITAARHSCPLDRIVRCPRCVP